MAAVKRWGVRAIVAALILASALVAWREGGGADPRVPPPVAQQVPAQVAIAGHGAAAYEVTTRLLDALGDAVIDVPSLAGAQPFLAQYWR